ncbi:hypothetical protein BDM02DRAFT_3120380 [Thelephora ganbajun]|uniref:Uncharacterized protein n=1 Tax=Thelephora ganbajun TaxID=370292 RepID=A0ACB6Z7I5_THEGA|nr:hypothetical protein BDM02DRAFT_3120380 [Thelephora ganbajun]
MSSSRLLCASLLPRSKHDPDLLQLLRQKITPEMVSYMAQKTRSTVWPDGEVSERAGIPTPPQTPFKTSFTARSKLDTLNCLGLPSLETFISMQVNASNVHITTFLATLIYLERLRPRLPEDVRYSQNACHRIFLATLIIAAKYLNDSCPKNIHWAKYTGYFGVFEITKTEIELLAVLDYDLRFDEAETCYYFAPFMRTRAQEKRAAAVSVVAKAGLARAQAQMPPTPPREKPSQSGSLSSVQGLVKRLSSVCLSSATTACASPAQRHPSASSSIQSTPSFTSDSSDMSSAADSDSEWPLLSDSAVDGRVHAIERHQIPPTNFHLKPVPAHAYRRLRKNSTTASSPSDAEGVECPRPANLTNSTPSSTLSALTIRLVNAPEDTTLDPESSGAVSGLPSRSVSWGSLLKNDTKGLTRTGTIHSRKEGGFLSRMWGAATRGINDRTDKQDLPSRVDIFEPEAQEDYGAGAIRHVTHSRSTIIRAQSQEYLV